MNRERLLLLSKLIEGMAQHVGTLIVGLVWAALVLPFKWLTRAAARPVQIYLSSTLDDLAKHRQAVADRLKAVPATIEGDPLNATQPKADVAERAHRIRNSDLFIGLYAWHYGPIIEGPYSYPEHELRFALDGHPEVHLWILPDYASWPANRMDPNKDAPDSDIQRLRSKARPTAKPFSENAAALANDVARAVLAFQRKNHRFAQLRAEIFDLRAFVISGIVAVVASLSLSVSLGHETGFGPKTLLPIAVASGFICYLSRLAVRLLVPGP